MKTTYAVLFTITIVLLLGCIGKLKTLNDQVEEIKEPVVVSSVNIDDKVLMSIAILEQKVDSLTMRVEDLEHKKNQ